MLLRDDTRVASLQCLSQLILEPSTEQMGCHASSTPSYVIEIRNILANELKAWSNPVTDLIAKQLSPSQRRIGLSGLARLAEIGVQISVATVVTKLT